MEETFLLTWEAALRMDLVKTQQLLYKVTWHAKGGVVTGAILEEAFQGLPTAGWNQSSASSALYSGFFDKESGLKRLQVLCVLLGKGSLWRKTEALWTMYTEPGDEKMGQTTLSQMCHDLISVSVEDLGRLDTESKVRLYLSGLKACMDEFRKEMVSKIAGEQEEITKSEFENCHQKKGVKDYFWSVSLRTAISKYQHEKGQPRFPANVPSISSQAANLA